MNKRNHTRVPQYKQVANVLRLQIVSLDTDKPVRLPSEPELAKSMHVARGTIRQALQVLKAEGLIQQAPGRGTITVPSSVIRWQESRHPRVIKVISSWQPLPDVPSSFYGQVYQGILLAGEESGYQVAAKTMGANFPRIGPAYEPENPNEIIGVVIVGIYDERIIAMHTAAGYPVVVTDYWSANPDADAVLFDCFSEGQMAVQFLLSLGHHDLFYVGNSVSNIDQNRRSHEADADQTEAGCRRALAEAGLSLPPDRVHFCCRQPSDVDLAVEWFVSMCPRPTAGIIFDSHTAAAFIRRLAERGLRCPEDVSIITKASQGVATGLAALRNDPIMMGRMAVMMLLDRAEGRRSAPAKLVLTSWLERGPSARYLPG